MKIRYISTQRVIFAISTIIFLLVLSQSFVIRAALAKLDKSDAEALISTISISNSVDARWFWQWRDETNGAFTFDSTTTRIGLTRRILPPTQDSWLLHSFSSALIKQSSDVVLLTTQAPSSVLSDLIKPYSDQYVDTLVKGDDYALLANASGTKLLLLFVKDSSELYAVDGLFDFIESERDILDGAYWVNTTFIDV